MPDLSTNDRALIDIFVYYQWKRVPDSIDKVVSRAALDNIGADAIEEFERDVRQLTPAERAQLDDPVSWKRMIGNARTDVIGRGSPEVLEAFAKLTLNVVHITNSKKAFVMGSHPVAKLHAPGKSHINDLETQIWLPIASDVAIAYTGRKPSRYITVGDAERIRHVNMATSWGSSLVASRSPDLTRSLITHVGTKVASTGL